MLRRGFAYAILCARKGGYAEHRSAHRDGGVHCRRERPFTGPDGLARGVLAMAVNFKVMEGLKDGAWWMGFASLSERDLMLHISCRC